jgi:hypothetical protein
MEYEGFKRSMDFLLEEINISTLVSDRHQTIAKHMREKLPKIIHYFDIWHLKKSKYSYTLLRASLRAFGTIPTIIVQTDILLTK